jgi:AraC-like DNA-binding protein
MLFDIAVYTPIFVTIFWAITFTTSPDDNQAHRKIISFFMLAAFSLYVSHAFYFQNQRESYWILDIVYTLSSLSIYPLYYYYLRGLAQGELFKKGDVLSFLPAVLLASSMLSIYLIMDSEQRLYYINTFLYHSGDELSGSLPTVQSILYYVGRTIYTLQVIVYFIKGVSLLKIYEVRIVNFYSYLEDKKLTWTILLTYTFFFASFLSIIFNIIGKATFIHSVEFLYIPSLLFSVIIFLIGLQANTQHHQIAKTNTYEMEDDTHFLISENKIQDELGERLDNLFLVQKMHLQPNLKITDISKKLATNRTYISNYINYKKGMTFSEYINSYRIKEAKEILQNKGYGDLKLDEVAEKSGFGSLRSFMRIFLQEEGFSPKEYKKKIHQKSSQPKVEPL